VTVSNVVTTLITSKVPYKTSDLEYLGMYGGMNMILIVNSNSPWKTLEELVDYAKKHPGELKYPSIGHGTGNHLVMEMFNKNAGIKTVHVPMKGEPEVLSSILGGHCHLAMCYESGTLPLKEGGKVRFLASASEKRIDGYPDVPTFAERGYPEVIYYTWYGVAGPKGIPKEVLDKLEDAFEKTFKDKEFHNMVDKFGVTPNYMSADQFPKFVYSEEKRLRKLIKEMGLAVAEEK